MVGEGFGDVEGAALEAEDATELDRNHGWGKEHECGLDFGASGEVVELDGFAHELFEFRIRQHA